MKITDIKSSVDGLNIRRNKAEERINELEQNNRNYPIQTTERKQTGRNEQSQGYVEL